MSKSVNSGRCIRSAGLLTGRYVLRVHGERIGTFATVEEAERAYDVIIRAPRRSWEVGCPAR